MTNYALVVFLFVVMLAGFILNPLTSALFAIICYVWVDRRVTGLLVLGFISLAFAGAIYALMHSPRAPVFRFPIEPLFFGAPIFGVPFVLLTVPSEHADDDEDDPDDLDDI